MATCDAGDYVLDVWCVEEIKRNRSSIDVAIYMNPAGPITGSGMASGEVKGTSIARDVSGVGIVGVPEKVFGIRVLNKKNRKSVKDAVFSESHLVTVENGMKAGSTINASYPETYRVRYFWPPAPPESRGNIPLKELIPLPVSMNPLLPVSMHRPASTSIKSLSGFLIIPNEETVGMTFAPAEIKNKARKSIGKYAVQIDSVEMKNESIELNVLVTLPPPARQPGDFLQSYMQEQQWALSTRFYAHVEDSAGDFHIGLHDRSGDFSVEGSNQKTKGRPAQKNGQSPQKLTFLMTPIPEGATTKELVVEVKQTKGAPQLIPFEFGAIQW